MTSQKLSEQEQLLTAAALLLERINATVPHRAAIGFDLRQWLQRYHDCRAQLDAKNQPSNQ